MAAPISGHFHFDTPSRQATLLAIGALNGLTKSFIFLYCNHMLVMRFFRVGKKNQPSFKIVVTDKRNAPRSGRFVEEVGFYNPITKEKILKKERVQYWLSKGVQPSVTVHNLLVKEGILEGAKILVHKKPKKQEAGS